MASFKQNLLGHTAACVHINDAIDTRKPKGNFTLFEKADGTSGLLNRESIDSGEVERAGIHVIDGDKPDPEQLRNVETAGNA